MAMLPRIKKTAAAMSPKRQMKHGSVLWLTVRKSIPAFMSRPLRQRFRRQRAPHFMIDPETRHKMAWDVLLTCCVLYTTCVVPYRVCFKRDATGGFATFESVLDLFFGADIALNFVTGVQLPSGEVTYDTATIVRSYLRGWFLVDFFSTIPFDDLSDWFGTSTDPRASKALSSAKLLRSLKVLRLFKLARIRKLTKLFLNLEDAVYTNQSLLSLVKLALTMLFLAHLVACLWFAIGNQAPSVDDTHTTISWVYEYEFQDQEPVLQYLVSVYWAIVTMVTIGYGDVLARNNLERLFNIAIMAIGVSFFGYVVGTITTLVSNLDVAAALYDERLTTVKEYIISRSIPAYMSKRLRDHFEYFYQNRSVFKEKNILDRLPSAMRNEIIHNIHAKVVARVFYFRQCHESLISAIVMSMRPFNVLKDEYVYVQHEIAAHVFFLLKGKVHLTKAVAVTMAKGRAPSGEWRLAALSVGEHFGELEVYDHEHGNGVRICSAIAKSYCELTFLSRQAISKISTSWPEVLRHFKDAAKDTSKRMRRRIENAGTGHGTAGSMDADESDDDDEDDGDDESDGAHRRLFHDDEMEQKMVTSTLLARKTMLARPPTASSRVAPYMRPESASKTSPVKPEGGDEAENIPVRLEKPIEVACAEMATDEVVTLTAASSVGEMVTRNHLLVEPPALVPSHSSSRGTISPFAMAGTTSLPASLSSMASDSAERMTAFTMRKPSAHGRIVLEALMAKKPTPLQTPENYTKAAPSAPRIEIVTNSPEQTPLLVQKPSEDLFGAATNNANDAVVSITPSANPVLSPTARKATRHSRARGSGRYPLGDLVDGLVEDDDDDDDEKPDQTSDGADPPTDHKPMSPASVPPSNPVESAVALAAAARFLPRLQPKLANAAAVGIVGTPTAKIPIPINAWKQVATTAVARRKSQLESRRNLSDILAKIRGSTTARPKPNFHSERALLKGTYILHPQEPFVLSWQFVVGIAILYSIIVVPYRLGFDADADGAWMVLENTIDCFFGVDILLNFRTAFFDDERLLVFDSRVILRRYVRGWFVVDFLSTVPVDDLARALMGGASIQFFPTKLLRLFRVARLLKLARLIKLSRVAGRLRDFVELSPSTERLGKLLMVMSLFCHWNACAFHAAMLASEGAGVANWCDDFFPLHPSDSVASVSSTSSSSSSSPSSQEILCSDRVANTDRYIAAVYWAFTTFTTVGYGDIRPNMYSTYELGLVILLVVINSTVYGYIISAVVTLIKNLDPSDREYRLRMTEMKDYLRDSMVSTRLSANIKAHYQHSLSCTSLFPEEKLFDKMSPSLRFDLARLVAGETLFAIPLITVMEDSFKGFVSYALFLMKPLCILRSEKVCRSGAPGMEMFFLVEGECDLLNSETNEGRIVGENAVFEQYSLMAHPHEIYRTVSTVTGITKKCVLYSLTIQDFKILEDVSPAVSTYFLSQLAAVLIDDDLFTLTPQQKINVECALRNGRAFRAVAEQHEKARLSTVSGVALAKLTAPRRRGSEWTPDLLPRALKRMDTDNLPVQGAGGETTVPGRTEP